MTDLDKLARGLTAIIKAILRPSPAFHASKAMRSVVTGLALKQHIERTERDPAA